MAECLLKQVSNRVHQGRGWLTQGLAALDGHRQIVDGHRCKLRVAESRLNGEKAALRRIQDLANEVRPGAPLVRMVIIVVVLRPLKLSMRSRVPFASIQSTWAHPFRNSRMRRLLRQWRNCMRHNFSSPGTSDARPTSFQPLVEFDLNYTDTAFIPSVLFNYSFRGFAKLLFSLTIFI